MKEFIWKKSISEIIIFLLCSYDIIIVLTFEKIKLSILSDVIAQNALKAKDLINPSDNGCSFKII